MASHGTHRLLLYTHHPHVPAILTADNSSSNVDTKAINVSFYSLLAKNNRKHTEQNIDHTDGLVTEIHEANGFYSCIILGLPSAINIDEFNQFIEPYRLDIRLSAIIDCENINHGICRKLGLLLFTSGHGLINFSQLYNNLHFPSYREMAPCLVIPLQSVCIYAREDVYENNVLYCAQNNMIEIPSCSICLRRMKSICTSIEGANEVTLNMITALPYSHCLVCTCSYSYLVPTVKSDNSSLSSNDLISTRGCMNCGIIDNIWICILCGYRGCGRYTSQHAQKHYDDVKHPFSLELATGRIWDYLNDTFIHDEDLVEFNNAMRSQSDQYGSANLPQEDQCGGGTTLTHSRQYIPRPLDNALPPHENEKLHRLHHEYELLLESQLADQDQYFEKQLTKEAMSVLDITCSTGGSNSNSRAAIITDEELDEVEKKKIEISLIEAENTDLLKMIADVERDIRNARKNNLSLIKENKGISEEINSIWAKGEEFAAQSTLKIAELEQQIIDLSFYSNTKKQIETNPLRDEIVGGSISISTAPPPPPTPKPNGKTKKK